MRVMNNPEVIAATHAELLVRRFRSRDACVAVVGLGYVGLPLACRFADAGFRTIGLDIDREKVEALAKGGTYLSTVPVEHVARANSQKFLASTDYALAAQADAIRQA